MSYTTSHGYSTCEVYWISRLDDSTSAAEVAGSAGDILSLAGDPLTRRDSTVQASGDAHGGWLATNGYSDVVTCSWNKDTSNPAGVFMLNLRADRDYLELIQPGDVMLVFMSSQKPRKMRDLTLVTIGTVDRVTESTTATGEGATVASVSVSGRDFGKILQETQTAFDPAFSYYEQLHFNEAFYARINDKEPGFSPAETVLHLLDLYYNEKATGNKITASQWRFPGSVGTSLMSLLNVKDFVQAPLFGYTIDKISPLQQGGNMWAVLESHANRVVNEFFIDVRDLTPEAEASRLHQESVTASFLTSSDVARQQALRDAVHANFQGAAAAAVPDADRGAKNVVGLVLRQLPYDTEAFYKLPHYSVDETEMKDFNPGRASHEVYNFLRMRFNNIPPDYQEFGYGIKLNEASVRAFGIKRFEAESMYPFIDSQLATAYAKGQSGVDPTSFTGTFDYYIGLLSTWYAYNELLLSGSMSMVFRPDIRVGCRLEFSRHNPRTRKPERIDFYIQAVQHSFMFDPGASRTTLTLVRGIKMPMKGAKVDAEARKRERLQNLIWNAGGPQMGSFNPWQRFTPANGFVADGGIQVPSAQEGR
jgi:hypothetical protein